jgi:predicted ATPase
MQPFVKTIHPRGVLSFAPDSEPLPLTPLNVLIGPNGSGKSNLIEIFELLKALPTDLPEVIRDGGGIGEWLWKGEGKRVGASIDADLKVRGAGDLQYGLGFVSTARTLEVRHEVVEDDDARYYRFDVGRRATMVRRIGGKSERILFTPDLQQSVLLQRRDPDLYPEVSALGRSFARILTFREWSFGRSVPLRQPQPADLPNDVVLPDARNLGLMVNAVEHSDAWPRMNAALSRFLPRFKPSRSSCMKTGCGLPYRPRDCPTERSASLHYWPSC